MDTPAEPVDEAITALYLAHWDRLVRVAWLLLRDTHAAEDVVQDAYVATHRRWSGLRDPGRVVGYLHAAVLNGCRSVQRRLAIADREHRRAAMSAGTTASAVPGTVESAEAAAIRLRERASMVAALDTLPSRQREVIILRFYGDLTEAQIAQALGISRGAVKSHAHRALRALRRAIGSSAPPRAGDPPRARQTVPRHPAPVWRSNPKEPS